MTNPMLGGRGRGWLHWRVEVGGGVTLEGRGRGGYIGG